MNETAREFYEKNMDKYRVHSELVVTDFTQYRAGGYIDIPKLMEAYHASQMSGLAQRAAEKIAKRYAECLGDVETPGEGWLEVIAKGIIEQEGR